MAICDQNVDLSRNIELLLLLLLLPNSFFIIPIAQVILVIFSNI